MAIRNIMELILLDKGLGFDKRGIKPAALHKLAVGTCFADTLTVHKQCYPPSYG